MQPSYLSELMLLTKTQRRRARARATAVRKSACVTAGLREVISAFPLPSPAGIISHDSIDNPQQLTFGMLQDELKALSGAIATFIICSGAMSQSVQPHFECVASELHDEYERKTDDAKIAGTHSVLDSALSWFKKPLVSWKAGSSDFVLDMVQPQVSSLRSPTLEEELATLGKSGILSAWASALHAVTQSGWNQSGGKGSFGNRAGGKGLGGK